MLNLIQVFPKIKKKIIKALKNKNNSISNMRSRELHSLDLRPHPICPIKGTITQRTHKCQLLEVLRNRYAQIIVRGKLKILIKAEWKMTR
jgi:hypothetical protein